MALVFVSFLSKIRLYFLLFLLQILQFRRRLQFFFSRKVLEIQKLGEAPQGSLDDHQLTKIRTPRSH